MQAGIVGLFYEATVESGMLIEPPEIRKVSSSVNVIIEQENFSHDVEQPGDRRRVKVLNQVYLESPVQLDRPNPGGPIQH